jgi:5,6-dimethylbenzimidazole synthase
MSQQPPEFTSDFRQQFDQLLRWRRDVRAFRTTPLDPNVVQSILTQTAQNTPSVGNAQPWRFVRVKTPQRRHEIRMHVEAEVQRSAQIYVSNTAQHYESLKLHGLDAAPEHVAVFSVNDPEEGKGLGRQTMPETLLWSTVMAIHTLWLTARANNIGLGWVSILEPEQINSVLDCPLDWRFVAYLCMGYPQETTQTPDLVKRDWQAPLPIEKMVIEK